MDAIRPNFANAFMLDRTRLGLLRINFPKYTTQLWALDIVKIPFLLKSCEQTMEFDQILHMHIL